MKLRRVDGSLMNMFKLPKMFGKKRAREEEYCERSIYLGECPGS